MQPVITQDQVRRRASAQSFARGQSYYQNAAIFDTARRGNQLEGRCEGSRSSPYRVQVVLGENDILEASCTCEYDWGGDCKHIVALLLTYVHRPDVFMEQTPVQETLMQRSKEDLITLIQQMVRRYPDLQMLIDRPMPGQHSPYAPLDTEPFRRELRQALHDYEGWGEQTAESAIYSIILAADQFARQDDWRSTCAIYRAIIEECLRQEDYPIMDEDGGLIPALNDVLERLANCLVQPEILGNDVERRAIFERLLDAEIWDTDMGGYGLAETVMPEAILEHAKPDDLPAIRERIQAAQQRKMQSQYGQWGTEAYAYFLIQLDAIDNIDPETTLRRLREQGLHRLVFDKLLAMGRSEEAIAVVTEHLTSPFERLEALPKLVTAGHDDAAVKLAVETVQDKYDERLAEWLAERYRARGDREAYFQWRLQAMEKAPSVQHYAALREAAEVLGTWSLVQLEVIRKLKQSQQYDVLTRVYLHDEEWDAAWETLEHIPQPAHSRWMGWGSNLDLEVAEKSKEARPHKAIPVYVKHARQQIDGRSRGTYAQAAVYLSIVRTLHRQINDEKAWQDLIAGIRAEFRRLPALQDELNKARL